MKIMNNNRVVRKLFEHPLAAIGIVVLVLLYGVMLFAEFIAPYSFDTGNRSNSFVKPSRIHFVHNKTFSPSSVCVSIRLCFQCVL